ncbi:MAG: hypothetical protein IPH41_13685 [Sulfuritalea sp.]|nr:hypothetical protein [Sulfuritalea sp.]
MAFTEFDGELDDEAGFKPFDGELDAPAPTAKPEPGLADRYRGQFEQAKKMMAPAPATSVLDRASRAPAADPMLRPEFIEEQRAIYGKMPEANRLPVLKRMATRDDVQGRAAKVLLAEAESVNATGRQAERDMPEFSRVIAEGPRVAPPAGTGLRKPRPVSFPDAQPDITEIGAMPTEAQTLARRGAGGVLAAAAADPATLAERARVDATDWNQVEFARENPVIAGAGSGGARALGGIINAPGTAAQFLAETLLNPISRRLGGDGFERVPNAPLVDGLMQAAQEWSSPQMTQEPMEAWDRDQFGTWLAANVAAQAPMFAQQVVAFMVPAARAMILPGMGAQVAGGEYAGGDSAVAAVGKGAAEAGSELISLGVMDKARSFFLKLPPGQRAAAVKDLAKRVGAASAAVVGSSAGESGTEILSQFGQNAIDQLAGKDTPLTSGLLASAIVGAVAGGGMMVPAAMTDLRRSSTDGSRMSVEDALITALETGQTRPAPPVIRVEDMPTTPLTPEQVAAIAPQPQVEPIPTGEVTELPGMPTDDGERIPVGQATELAGPRAATPADLGVASVPQGSLAAMAEQQLRGRFVQPVVPADAPLAAPAADAGRDQPGRSGGALGRMADDGRAGSVLPGEPVPAGRGAANQPAAVGATPGGLNAATPAGSQAAPTVLNRARVTSSRCSHGQEPDPTAWA